MSQLVGTLVAGAERRAREIDALRQRLETPATNGAPAKTANASPAPSPPLTRELARLTHELQAALAQRRTAEDQVLTLQRELRDRENNMQRLRQEQAKAVALAEASRGDVQGLQARIALLEEQAVEANLLLEAARKELEQFEGQRRRIQDLEGQIAAQQEAQRTAGQAATQAAERLAAQTREWHRKIEAAQRQERALAETLDTVRREAKQARQASDDARATLQRERDALQKTLETLRQDMRTQEDNVRRARATGDALAQRINILETELEAARRTPPAPPKPMWYLKLEDGTLLGPSEEEVLAEWARLCRIGPTHQLSRDREHWVAAASVPGLGMDWMVELADGNRFGPIHLLAVTVLMADGSVRPEACLSNPKTGMVFKAGDAAIPQAARAIEAAEALRRELAQLKAARALNVDAGAVQTVPPPKSVRTEAWRRLQAAPPTPG